MRIQLLVAVLLATSAATSAAAPDVARLAAIYGARESAWSMQMSPSGDKVLYMTPAGTAGTAVVTADLVSGKTSIVLSADKPNVLPSHCGWKSETRVICRVRFITYAGAQELVASRSFSIAADGSSRIELGVRSNEKTIGLNQRGARVIDWLPDDPAHVLMEVYVPEQDQLDTNIRRDHGTSVQRVDVNTGAMTPVERGDEQVDSFDSDDHGEVRYKTLKEVAATGYLRDNLTHMVRARGSKTWIKVHEERLSGRSRWEYLGFDESAARLLTLRDVDGRLALFRDGIGDGSSELLFAHPRVDVDGVLRIGKWRRPVAAVFTDDSTSYHYFDPVLEKRGAALAKALPGNPPVSLLDESWDGSRNLLFAGGLADPGHYYRYDLRSRQLSPLMPMRDGLADLPPGPQRAVSFKAADGTSIPAVLTEPPGPRQPGRPAIIMPHGGPAYRDSLGFDWLAQFWVQQGYVVLQPNFRGSSGYGAAWYMQNGFRNWSTAIGDVNAGARWLASEGIADPRQLVMFGWSYGGYAALQAAIVEPGLYKAVVAIAPVTDLARFKSDFKDFTNYPAVAAMIGDGAHVAAGSPAMNAARLTVPVLMFHGTRDQNVSIGQSRAMDSALASAGKAHRLVVYDGLDHQLADSAARTDMLKQSAEFVAAALR